MAANDEQFIKRIFEEDVTEKEDSDEKIMADQKVEGSPGNGHRSPRARRASPEDASLQQSSAFSQSILHMHADHEMSTASVEQSKKQEHRIKLIKKSAVLFLILMVLGIAYKVIDNKIKDIPYQEALKLFDEGKYHDSLIVLEKMWLNGSSDVLPLIDAIRSFKEYESGDIEEAYRYMNKWSEATEKNKAVRYLPEKYTGMIQDLQEQVNHDYKDVMNARFAEEEKAREKHRQEAAEAKEYLKDKMPYIGMNESYVSYTRLGNYSHCNYSKRNSRRTYIFKDSQGRETYTVTCNDLIVTGVFDKVNNRVLTKNNTWKKYGSYSSDTKQDDPYNAKDYSNEEDFYDDHWDDFFDYYQAEDYWREHH